MVKVSVIIPVYNEEEILRTSLGSIINQTLTDLEIICVDDHSTDATASILTELQRNDSRIQIIKTASHQGAAKCRNFGLDKATGKYVIFLDSDDFFFKDMLEELCKLAENNHADVVMFSYQMQTIETDVAGKEYVAKSQSVVYERKIFDKEKFDEEFFTLIDHVPWNKLVSRELLLRHGIRFQDLPSNNDIFYSYAVALSANRLLMTDQVLMCYYYGRKGSLTESRKRKTYFVQAYAKTYRDICRMRKEWSEGFVNYILNSLQGYFEYTDRVKETEQDVLWQLKQNEILCQGIEEHAVQKTLHSHNQFFWECIQQNENVFGVNRYKYYVKSISAVFQNASKQNKKIALWGYGKLGKRFVEMLDSVGLRLDYIIDENSVLQGQIYEGYEIFSYARIHENVDIVLVLNPKFYNEISERAKGKKIIRVYKEC